MKSWKLKKGADKRLRSGHPWVFVSELAQSAREAKPGEVVAVEDYQGHFLGYGMAHPASQICFRKLSSLRDQADVLGETFIKDRLRQAHLLRLSSGMTGASHRWAFAEGDGLPGLIIDAYLSAQGQWIVVVQITTSGFEIIKHKLFMWIADLAVDLFGVDKGQVVVVESANSSRRKLEGLDLLPRSVVVGEIKSLTEVEVVGVLDLRLKGNLRAGQKTGLFLDQQWNAMTLRSLLRNRSGAGPMRILDVCCYVGQWAAHAAAESLTSGRKVEVDLLDVSTDALAQAERNVRAVGAKTNMIEADALKGLESLPPGHYDLVICDPPAFVKKKTDLEAGLQAYVKINRNALRLVKPGGLIVMSSCSGLVRESDWQQVIAQASAKAGRRVQFLAPGGHGPDHPVRSDFPEGQYLKCAFAQVDYPF